MKLYHGSRKNFASILKSQATKADNIEVPEKELFNAIYLTPDYGFALACAARPAGITKIDNERKSIIFENPNLFDPEKEVFVYEVDIDISKENVVEVDDHQYVVVGIDELDVSRKFLHKAKDVKNYYKLENWKEEPREASFEFRMR